MGNFMKKLSIVIVLILLLSSCSVQEKMNSVIFYDRFRNTLVAEITTDEILFDNNRDIAFFTDKNGTDYALEFSLDEQGNIKKICLACTDTSKTDMMKYYFEKVINVYAPSENTDEIIQSLFSNNWNYHSSQWYNYTFVKSDECFFASVENKKISTQSDAELTLRVSEIIR